MVMEMVIMIRIDAMHRNQHRRWSTMRPGVNFINVIRTKNSYERNFFYVQVTRENNVRTKCSYEIFVRIMLMKLSTEKGESWSIMAKFNF